MACRRRANLQGAGRLRDRADPRQARALGGGAQPLQAAEPFVEDGYRAEQVEHPADRADGLRQDAARPDAGPHPRCALHHGGCDDADRGGLCRRGCGKHHPEASAGQRVQCRAGAARDRLHRRGRQDHAEVGQPLDHPGRLGRGRAAGAAEDHGRHCRLGAPPGRRKHPQQEFLQVDTTNICSSAGGPSRGWRRSSRSATRARASGSAPM